VVIEVAVARICETLRTWGFRASKTLFGGSHSFSAAKHRNTKKKNGDPIQGKPVSKFLEMNLQGHCSLSLSLSLCVDLLSLFVLED
jgi:hypothetical protein